MAGAGTFGSFDEFWTALTRLYESTLRLGESQKQSDERVDRLTSQVATLAGTVAQLATIVESHERRISRLEDD